MIRPIDSTASRFFATNFDSDTDTDADLESTACSDSESEQNAPKKPVDFSQLFRNFVTNPPLDLRSKKSDSLMIRFCNHVKLDLRIDEEMPSATSLMHDCLQADSIDDIWSMRKEVVKEYVAGISQAPDSPSRKLRSKYLQQALDLYSTKLSPAPRASAQYHRESFGNFSFVERTVFNLKRIPCTHYDGQPPSFLPLINLAHIVEGETQGATSLGYHLNVQAGINVTILARNPVTRVFCGTFRLPNCSEKFSTFFPPSVNSEDALVTVLQDAEKIARQDNRLLYRTKTDVPFYLEKLFQKEGCVVQSAYPLFYYGDFATGQTYQIAETETSAITSTEILNALSTLPIVENYTRYTLEDHIIVDIAPLFVQRTQVRSGIDFRFPKGLLPYTVPTS